VPLQSQSRVGYLFRADLVEEGTGLAALRRDLVE